MPFSSAYYSDNTIYSLPFWFYSLNITFTGLLNYAMLSYIIKHKGRISDGFDDLKTRQLARWRTLIVPVIFLFGATLDALLPSEHSLNMLSRFTPMLIWPAIMLLNKFFGKVHELEYHEKPKTRRRK